MPRSETDGERTLADAKQIVDSNLYMTLATPDGAGRPWPSPVWYAHEGYTEFLWVSKPDARHSRNLAGRPELGIVIFDSTLPGDCVAALCARRQRSPDPGRPPVTSRAR